LAEKSDEKTQEELFKILLRLRKLTARRTVIAWERSQETFGDEIVALNDIAKRCVTIKSHGTGRGHRKGVGRPTKFETAPLMTAAMG